MRARRASRRRRQPGGPAPPSSTALPRPGHAGRRRRDRSPADASSSDGVCHRSTRDRDGSGAPPRTTDSPWSPPPAGRSGSRRRRRASCWVLENQLHLVDEQHRLVAVDETPARATSITARFFDARRPMPTVPRNAAGRRMSEDLVVLPVQAGRTAAPMPHRSALIRRRGGVVAERC